MSLFDIEDNTIDFDSQDNSTAAKSKPADNDLPWLNENTKEFNGAVEKMKAGKSSIEALRKFFKISKAMEQKLKDAVTTHPDGLPAPIRNENGTVKSKA